MTTSIFKPYKDYRQHPGLQTTTEFIASNYVELNVDPGNDAPGDLLYRSAGDNLVRLGIGTVGQVLTSNGSVPYWADAGAGSGTVTSVNATINGALGVTGGPITTLGTLAFAWQGNNTQYVRGDGTLATFPTIPPNLTFDNALTRTVNNVQLGGTLLHDTIIDAGEDYTLYINGTGINTLKVNTDDGYAVWAETTGGGTAVLAIASGGIGVDAYTDGSYTAVSGNVAGDGIGVLGISAAGMGGFFSSLPSSVATIHKVVEITRGTTGTALNGIGLSLDFSVETTLGAAYPTNQIVSKWTTVTHGSRVSQLIITGTNNAITSDLLTLSGNGAFRLNKYGLGTFTGTETFWLGVDATGNVIELAAPSGGISGITANNGLTANTTTNVQLGGTLIQNTTITGAGFYTAFSGGRVEFSKGTDVASANNLTLGGGGNTFGITGTTQVNAITTTNWQAGSFVYLLFNDVTTVKHNTAGGAGTAPILLAGSVDLTTDANTVLTLIYNGTQWEETSRKQSTTTSTYTFQNALTQNPVGVVELGYTGASGSPLLHNTYINTLAFNLTVNGNPTLQATMSILNVNGVALEARASGSGTGATIRSETGNALAAHAAGGGVAGRFSTNPSSTNTIVRMIEIDRGSNSTAANGIGGSIVFQNQTTTQTQIDANQIISKWTNATHAARTSQLIITGVNSATEADLFTLSGNGALKLNKYGVGTFTGTAVYNVLVDANGNFIEGSVPVGGGISGITADNGLTANTSTNVQLGSLSNSGVPLTSTRYINTGSNTLRIRGNSSLYPLYAENIGSGFGAYIESLSGIAAQLVVAPASTNTVVPVLNIVRGSSGTAANGIGGQIDWYNQTVANGSVYSGSIANKWTTAANASRSSQWEFIGINNTATETWLTLKGTGQSQFNKYGVGTFTGTAAYTLQVDSSGNIIEGAVGGSDTNFAANDLTLTGDRTHTFSTNMMVLNTANANTSLYSFAVQNSGAGGALGASNNGGGSTVSFNNSGIGDALLLTAASGRGLIANSTGSSGVARFVANPTSTNSIVPIIHLDRNTSGSAANGIGGSLEINVETTTNLRVAAIMAASWTTVTDASRVSKIVFSAVDNAVTNEILTLNGNKSIKANGYGINTFAGTAAYILGVDASGNVVETALGGGSGANALGTYIVQTSTNAPANAQVLASLATGIVKNTTTTGVLSIAVAADFPTLNQNTTGSAATLTTTRTIWGQNFNGSANVTGDITLGASSITMTGSIGATGARVTKGWFADGEFTNMPTVGGTALSSTFSPIAGSASITTLGTIATGVWNGTALTSTYLPATTVYTGQANSYTAGMKQTFAASATTAGFAFAGVTADPSGPASGDMWYRSDTSKVCFRDTGATRAFVMENLAATLTNKTLTTPVIDGTITGTGQATAATPSTITMRDANANITANNWLGGYTTTATAAGTTTLTVASTYLQYFTGATTQTVTLPVTSTLTLGHQFVIVNNSTGAVTVNSSGGNAVVIVASGTSAILTCILTSGTTAASWGNQYSGDIVSSGKSLTVTSTMTLTGTDGKGINIGAATSGKILIGDGTNLILSTPSYPNAASTSGFVVTSNGTDFVSSANTGGWTTLRVSGSNATTTGQTLVDITGLVSGTLTNATLYEIEAVLYVTTSAVTTGTQYGIGAGGSGGAAEVFAVVLGTSTTNATASSTLAAASTAAGTFLTTSASSGVITIKGFVLTRGAGTATISIQHLKVTSGTSTVKIGSVLRYRLAS